MLRCDTANSAKPGAFSWGDALLLLLLSAFRTAFLCDFRSTEREHRARFIVRVTAQRAALAILNADDCAKGAFSFPRKAQEFKAARSLH